MLLLLRSRRHNILCGGGGGGGEIVRVSPQIGRTRPPFRSWLARPPEERKSGRARARVCVCAGEREGRHTEFG